MVVIPCMQVEQMVSSREPFLSLTKNVLHNLCLYCVFYLKENKSRVQFERTEMDFTIIILVKAHIFYG